MKKEYSVHQSQCLPIQGINSDTKSSVVVNDPAKMKDAREYGEMERSK
jgi:hypothetical protein